MITRTLNRACLAAFLIVAAGIATPCVRATQENTSLHKAAFEGNVDRVRALLATDAGRAQLTQCVNLNLDHKLGHLNTARPPLHFAAQGGNLEVAHILITHSAAVNSLDALGYTPLQAATKPRGATGHRGWMVAQLLLENGADVNKASGKLKQTALHIAVVTGDENMARLLVEHDAYLHARNYRPFSLPGHTPASLGLQALELGQLPDNVRKDISQVVRFLVRCGADVIERDWQGLYLSIKPQQKAERARITVSRLQAVKAWTKSLQRQYRLPADIENLLPTFALTQNQCELFTDEEFMKTNPETLSIKSGSEID